MGPLRPATRQPRFRVRVREQCRDDSRRLARRPGPPYPPGGLDAPELERPDRVVRNGNQLRQSAVRPSSDGHRPGGRRPGIDVVARRLLPFPHAGPGLLGPAGQLVLGQRHRTRAGWLRRYEARVAVGVRAGRHARLADRRARLPVARTETGRGRRPRARSCVARCTPGGLRLDHVLPATVDRDARRHGRRSSR